MLVVMSNTHIEGGEGGREEKRWKRRRGRGLRQWQRATRAPRERQDGAAGGRGWGWDDMSCGFKGSGLLAGCYSGVCLTDGGMRDG